MENTQSYIFFYMLIIYRLLFIKQLQMKKDELCMVLVYKPE